MGASTRFMTIDGNVTEQELKDLFYQRQEDDEDEYGSNPYNGSFSTFRGISIKNKVFSNDVEAEDYIADNTCKWGDAWAVRIVNEKQNLWLIGGWVAE